ncbi:MAG: hypothetical protein LBU69_00725, partial [Deltaproteobacteria bacterium]|nr:hypothetical protein [Deltaproteobacteria bacterium]
MNAPSKQKIARALGWASSKLGARPDSVDCLAEEGSQRSFMLLNGHGAPVVLMVGPDKAENERWLYLGKRLRAIGLPLPKILFYNRELGAFIMESLGAVR